jgi:hypothetical protein
MASKLQSGIVAHFCEHSGCSAWGAFGYSRGKNQPSLWHCYEHRDDGERYLGRA